MSERIELRVGGILSYWMVSMAVSRRLIVSAGCVALVVCLGGLQVATGLIKRISPPSLHFRVAPYLQPGPNPRGGPLELLWQTEDFTADWSVEVSSVGDSSWLETTAPVMRRVDLSGLPPSRFYRVSLLPAYGSFEGGLERYRVLRNAQPVYSAGLQAQKKPGSAERVVVLGDCASATSEQRAVAFQIFQTRPDYAVISGDIVYTYGRMSEYLDHFFPIYNADRDSPETGAPLLRSIPFYAAPGNHDLIMGNMDLYSDALAYFYYWSQPLNGPLTEPYMPSSTPLKGASDRRKAFLESAGEAFPRMANFSFDRGPIHWVVLDSNSYVDWTDPSLVAWLEADLAGYAARKAAWRLVVFHHPPFQSSKAHQEDQWMRVLAPVFEKTRVSVVFSGHVHNYQRTHPLRFLADDPKTHQKHNYMPGRWTLDRTFDGALNQQPHGVIYLVSGGGGARLYNTEQHDKPETYQEFTARFVSNVHSFTVIDATDDNLSIRQLSDQGAELDRIQIHSSPALAPASGDSR